MEILPKQLIIRDLGLQDYEPIWHAMQTFTAERDETTPDELWCLQHPALFTMGLNAKSQHLLNPGEIPVLNIDRGGQVTYHGPGQLVIYTLIDLKRLNIGVKDLVTIIETSIINVLSMHGIKAETKKNAPGVYVNGAKIAALGLRIKRNKSYHGLSLNMNMDLTPFTLINPCGYAGMPVTQMADIKPDINLKTINTDLVEQMSQLLGYNKTSIKEFNQLAEL